MWRVRLTLRSELGADDGFRRTLKAYEQFRAESEGVEPSLTPFRSSTGMQQIPVRITRV